MAIQNKFTKVESVLLSEIEVVPNWNARLVAGEKESSGGPDEGSFEGLVKSIEVKGQDTPVVLRAQKGKKPYFLVAGFRRFFAICKIAEQKNDKTPTIRAEIRELSDVEAREVNVRENTSRDGLSGPDLCYGVGQLLEVNKGFTSVAMAAMLGMNQSYIAKMQRIWEKVDRNIVKSWRESKLPLTTEQMAKLSELPKDQQIAQYTELTSIKEPSKVGRGAWIETAKKKGNEVGALLGALVRGGHIQLIGDDFFGDTVRILVPFKKDATEEQVARIAGAAEKAFSLAYETEAEPATDEEREAVKAKKVKNGGIVAQM